MSQQTKTLAIVGAGVAGIVAAKTAYHAGFHLTVYDKSSFIGGLWAPNGLIWSRMHTNIGNYSAAFADFPWPKGGLVFPNTIDVYQYLLSYVKHFGIEDRFRLNTKVESVKLLDDKRWQITSVCNGQSSVEVFDYCIISTGFNSHHHLPDEYNDAKESYKGVIMHSADYKSSDPRLIGKDVVVVGSSVSAVEVASDVVIDARSVTNLFRNKYLVLPKIYREDSENGKVKLKPLDAFDWSRRVYYSTVRENIDDLILIKNVHGKICRKQVDESIAHPALFIDWEKVDLAKLKFSASQEYIDLVQSSKIIPKQAHIASFRSDGIVTDEGTFIKADAIIFCTSHRIDFPFFDQETLRVLNYDEKYLNDTICLYKNTWHPDLPNMGFVGMVQSVISIIGELQAKWVIQVFNQDLSLPSRDAMLSSIDNELEKREYKQSLQFPYPFVYLCDMISSELGLLDLEKEKRENPELYEMLWNGPVLPEHFQLNDPEKRQSAIEHIKWVNSRFNRDFTEQEADSISVHNFY